MDAPHHLRARLAVLGAALLFSTGGMAIKASSLAGVQVACLRSAIAALALLLFIPGARPPWTRAALYVALAQAATLVLFVSSNKLTTAANAIFLQSTAPLYVTLLSPFLLHERLRGRDVAVIAITVVGLGAFFFDAQAPLRTAQDPALGNLLAAGAGAAWALTIMGLRTLGRGARGLGMQAVAIGNLLAALGTLPFALPLPALGARDVAVVLALGVVQVAMAYALLSRGLAEVRAVEGAILLLLEPALSPLWAWLAHDEAPGAWSLAGGALIVGATLASAWADARAEQRRAASS